MSMFNMVLTCPSCDTRCKVRVTTFVTTRRSIYRCLTCQYEWSVNVLVQAEPRDEIEVDPYSTHDLCL